jgi:hypothetical protein
LTPLLLSASQIESYADCPRKWSAKYIGGLEGKRHPSTKVGVIVHTHLENYLKHGKAPNKLEHITIGGYKYYPGRIAHSMIPHLPPAGSIQEGVEDYFEVQIGDFWFRGYKDLRTPTKLYDHKTTSNLQYAKTIPELKIHPQPLIYAYDEIVEKGLPDPLPCQWTYGQTKSKNAAKARIFTMSSEEIATGLDKYVLPVAEQISKARDTVTEWKSLAPNARMCDQYGGCSYKDDCKLSGRERLVAIMNKEELMAKIRARKAAQEGAVDKPAEETKPAVEAKTEEAPKLSALDKVRARKAQKAGSEINSPEQEETKGPDLSPLTNPTEISKAVAEVATKVREATSPQTPPQTSPQSPGFSLFVDCEPLNWPGNMIRAENLISSAAAQVCEDADAPHYKVIDFGKGGGFLAAQIRENLTKAPLPAGTALLLTLRTNEGRDVFQTLYEMASSVVLGR